MVEQVTDVLSLLKAADALLATEDQWCQGYLALNAAGCHTGSNADDAVQWCATGALRHFIEEKGNLNVKETSRKFYRQAFLLLNDASSRLTENYCVILANDEIPGTFEGIKEIYAAAIADAEGLQNG